MERIEEVRSLSDVSRELRIPVVTLLHHSSRGHLPLYVMPPHRHIAYYSVHTDFFEQPQLTQPDLLPVLTAFGDVAGLAVPSEDIDRLAAGQDVKRSFFCSLIHWSTAWTETAYPRPRKFVNPLRMEGWFIAAYQDDTSEEAGLDRLRSPLDVAINPSTLRVRSRDIDFFLRNLRTYHFLGELFSDNEIIEELPPFISTKLAQTALANRTYWSDYKNLDASQREDRRKEVAEFFSGAFLQACDKKSEERSLLELAMDVCDPSLVPVQKRQKTGEITATPKLLSLLAAAKLFWSPHLERHREQATDPQRGDVAYLLQRMGLTAKNEASCGATLIRPEGVKSPKIRRTQRKAKLKSAEELAISGRRTIPG